MAIFEEVIKKIQNQVFPKRGRVNEFFTDFDNLRRGLITQQQFVRVLNLLIPTTGGVILTPQEIQCLVDHYKQEDGQVFYKGFCEEIEKVFTTKHLDKVDPHIEVNDPGYTMTTKQYPKPDERMEGILHRVACLAQQRRFVIKAVFSDMDRGENQALTVPRRQGKCTKNNFKRAFPFPGQDVSQEEVDLIIERYMDDLGNVDYQAFHLDVTSQLSEVKDQPIPTSIFVPHQDAKNVKWSREEYDIVDLFQQKVSEMRPDLHQVFKDFDPLKKGKILDNQLDLVLQITGLQKHFSVQETDQLKDKFQEQDLNLRFFNWQKLMEKVDSQFYKKDIHTDPLQRTKVPGPEIQLPQRRSRVEMSEDEKKQLCELEHRIRKIVLGKRILFKNNFKDFDRGNTGHVTMQQFERVMQTLNMPIQDAEEVRLLKLRYCDLGDNNRFNYREFVQACDPVPEELDLQEQQNRQPFEDYRPPKYFDRQGRVYQQ